MKKLSKIVVVGATVAIAAVASLAAKPSTAAMQGAANGQLAPGLSMPVMIPERGKKLFASKGCVVCHSINGVGGTDAASLDAKTMAPMMEPFEFFAKMWRGAEPMISMQQKELGHQIEFTGQDLADIVAFAHNARVQKTFTKDDIPAEIKKLMDSNEDEGSKTGSRNGDRGGHGMMHGGSMMGMPPH